MELKTYSDWSLENNEADPAEKIRNYADYVRTTNFKAGGLNAEVEQGITEGVAQLALKEGIATEDMAEEEFKGIVGDLRSSKKANADADAKLLLDHYTLDQDPSDPEVAAKAAPLRRYLTMRRMSPELVETDGVLDAVNPLLSDPDSIRAARKAAVDRGDLQLVAVDELDAEGKPSRQIYTGANTTRESVTGKLDALIASGAIRPGDLPDVEDHLRPLFGGVTTTAEYNRGHDFARTFDELAKKDPTLLESLKLDADDLRRTNEAAQRSTGEKIWEGTKTVAGGVLDALVGSAMDAGRSALEGMGVLDPKAPKPQAPRNVVERLSQNEAIRNAFTPEEIEKFGSSLVQRAAGPAYRADKPGSGIAVDAMGAPIIAQNLIPNKGMFDKELESSALNEEQKAAARLSREETLAKSTPTYVKMISEEDGAAATALAQHRATGGSDTEFVEKWLSDPANYSGFSERAQQLGATVAGIVPQLALAIPSLLGHEGSTKAIIAMQKDQQDRQQYAQLFGDEFGMGFDILNTIPQVATDVLATIGTGAAYAGAKGVLRGGVRAASRAAIKSTVAGVSREAAMLTKGAAAAGGEASIGIAFSNLGKELATKLSTVEKLAPVGAVAFTRSAGASYAQIYNQLDPKLTHAEKHEKAVGYAVATGIGTALTVMGMSILGRGGVEDLATRRIRPLSLGDDVIDDATQTVKATGVRNIPLSSLNYKQAKRLYEDTYNASKLLPDGAFQAALRKNIGNAWKNYFRTTLKGGWDEGLEESIDQGIQMKLEDAAMDRETPLADKIDQYWKAFVLGGAMGAGSAGVSQLVQPLNRNEVGVALDARMTILSKTAADLRKTGSNATAASLERELGRYRQIAGERAAKEAAERAKAEADKAAGIEPETPSEKRFDNDMEEGTFLGDLDGSFVHLDGDEGRVVIEDGNAYFVPQKKKFKAKAGEVRIDPATNLPVADESYRETKNRILLGPANKYAAGVVTKLPTLPRTEDGNYFVNVGKQRFRLPTIEEFQGNPEAFFEFAHNAEGEVTKIYMKNLPGLDGPNPGNKLETNKYRIRQLAKRYGLDIEPRPPVAAPEAIPEDETPVEVTPPAKSAKLIFSKGGQAQFDFVEGRLPDVPAATLDEASPEPEPVTPNPVIEEIEKGIAQRKAWITKLAKDPAQASNVTRWKQEVKSLEARRVEVLTPEYTDQELKATPEYLWDEAMGFLVENTNRKLLQSKYAETGDVETNAQVLDALVNDMMDKDWGADPQAALREFDTLEGMNLDLLEETADVMQSFMENPPEGLPPISDEMRSARFQWVDDFRANIGLARRFMADRSEREAIAEANAAADQLRLEFSDRRDGPEWQADIVDRSDLSAPVEAEDSDAPDGEEATEAPAPEPLHDRVVRFVSTVERYQRKLEIVYDKLRELPVADRDEALANFRKGAQAQVRELVNERGRKLYQESAALQEIQQEVRDELMQRIELSVGALGARLTSRKTGQVYKKEPKTFLTPPNAEWKGVRHKPKAEKFRTEGERQFFGMLVERGAAPGWKVETVKVDGKKVKRVVRTGSLSELGRRQAFLKRYNHTLDLAGIPYVFTPFTEGKPEQASKSGKGSSYTPPGDYLEFKNRQLAEEINARYPETGTYFVDSQGFVKYRIGKQEYPVERCPIPGLLDVLVPVNPRVFLGSGTVYEGVFTNNPTTTAAQRAMSMVVDVPVGFKNLNKSIVLESPTRVRGAYLPGDLSWENGSTDTLIEPGKNIAMTELHASKAGRPQLGESESEQARQFLFLRAFVDPTKAKDSLTPHKVGGNRAYVAGGMSRALTDKQVPPFMQDELEALNAYWGEQLDRTAASSRSRSALFDEDARSWVRTEIGTRFTMRFNEYRLAQALTNYLIGRASKDKDLSKYPGLVAYTEGIDSKFEELPPEVQAYIKKAIEVDLPLHKDWVWNPPAKEATIEGHARSPEILRSAGKHDIASRIRFTDAVDFLTQHFQANGQVPLSVLADGLRSMYNIKATDPNAVLLQYAQILFTGAVQPEGDFFNVPHHRDLTTRTMADQLSNTLARRKIREEGQGRIGSSVKASSSFEQVGQHLPGGAEGSGQLGFMQLNSPSAFDEEGQYSLGQKIGGEFGNMLDTLKGMLFSGEGDTMSWEEAEGQASQSPVWNASPGGVLLPDRSTYIINSLYATIKDNEKVRQAFDGLGVAMAKHLGIPGLARLTGGKLFEVLSNTVNDMVVYQEASDFLAKLDETPQGKRAAALLVAAGWLPPVTISSVARKGRGGHPTGRDPLGVVGSHTNVRSGVMTPEETLGRFGALPNVSPTDSPDSILQKGREIHQSMYRSDQRGLEKVRVEDVETMRLYDRRLRQAQENLQGDLMDLVAEQAKVYSKIDTLAFDLNQIQEDLALLGGREQLADQDLIFGTYVDGQIKDRVFRLGEQERTLRYEADQLEEEAGLADTAASKERDGQGLNVTIDALYDLLARPVRFPGMSQKIADQTTKAVADATGSKAKITDALWLEALPAAGKRALKTWRELGLSGHLFRLYHSTEDIEARRDVVAANLSRTSKMWQARMARLPQLAVHQREQAQARRQQADILKNKAEWMQRSRGDTVSTVIGMLEQWDESRDKLKELRKEASKLSKEAKDLVEAEVTRLEHVSRSIEGRADWKVLRDAARTHPIVLEKNRYARLAQQAQQGGTSWAPNEEQAANVAKLLAKVEAREKGDERVQQEHNARVLAAAAKFRGNIAPATLPTKGEFGGPVGGHFEWRGTPSPEEIGGYVDKEGNVVASLPSPGLPTEPVNTVWENVARSYDLLVTETDRAKLRALGTEIETDEGNDPALEAAREFMSREAFNRFIMSQQARQAGIVSDDGTPVQPLPLPELDPAAIEKYGKQLIAPSYGDYMKQVRAFVEANPDNAPEKLKQELAEWLEVLPPDPTLIPEEQAAKDRWQAKYDKMTERGKQGLTKTGQKIIAALKYYDRSQGRAARIREQVAWEKLLQRRNPSAEAAVEPVAPQQDLSEAEWIETIRRTYGEDINNPRRANDPQVRAVWEWDMAREQEQERSRQAQALNPESFNPRLSRVRTAFGSTYASMSTIDPALRDAANESNTEEMNALGLKDGDSESMIGALKILRQSGPPHLKLVSDILLAGAGDYIRTVNLVVVEMDNGFAGLYDKDTNSVIINLNEHNGRGLADVLVHELLHGATVNVLSNPRTAAQRAAAARISQLRNMAQVLANKQGVTSPAILHGLESDAEFITYALTAPEFQSLLKGLALPEQRNVWQRLIDRVLEFFGLDPAQFRKQRNAVEELLDFAKMGMAHRRTFTTDLRWDQHEADRVNEVTNRFNFHADRLAMEKDGVFAARRSNKATVRETVLSDGSIEFTARNGFGVLETTVANAEDAAEIRARYQDTYGRPATQAEINGLRFAMPSPGTGARTIDPLAELRTMMPPGMEINVNGAMLGMMATRRNSPGVIIVNPEAIVSSLAGLKPDKARAVLRATLDEELAELAADTVMSDDDYTELAGTLDDSQRSKLENSYFGVMLPDAKERAAKIAELRESGQWTDADLGREWFRQHVTRMALGSTREQILEYKDSNPGLFQKIIDAITNYISVLKDRLAASFTNGTAARISQASRELRRLRNNGVLPDPERAPAGEYGDTTAFLNMLDNHEVTGQEDRTRFALPVYGEDAKVGGFWKAVRSRFYDMAHPELKAILDIKSGTNKAIEYTMKEFNRRFPQMRDAALAAGIAMDDIMLAFGTTAPMVSADERAAINTQLKSEGLGWKKSQFDPAVRAEREARERVLYDDAARRMAAAFRIRQQAMEASLRDQGFGEMVDFIIENRNILNKYKVQIGFGETNDVYLTRTYRYFKTPAWAAAVKAGSVFTDPETGETVDFGALRRIAADEMFKAEVLKNAKKEGKRLSDTEVAEKVMAELDKYLLELDGRAATSNTLDGVVMLRKDLNLLKTKKDLDFPLRHLLGEVKDPFETYLRTLYNVSRYASNEQFLQDFTDKAIELGLATYEPTDGMELLFPARKELEYDKLAGLYVRKDIANAIRDEFLHKGPSSEPNGQAFITKAITRPAAWISGASIFTKTSLGVGYWARNMMSNLLLTTAQGLNPFSFHAFKAANMARLANIDKGNNSTEEQRDHIRRLTELQIVRDDVNGRMVLDLMHGFAAGTEQQVDDMLKAITQAQVTGDMGLIKKVWTGSKVPAAFNWLVEGTANLNNFVDSFPKINAFYQELASLRKSYGDTKTEAELEALAARKVKLTFPTHSQQLSAVKAFNKSPLGLAIIPFLRWKTEVVRTMINTPALILEEWNSDNANEKWRAAKRLMGFAGTVGGGGSMALSAVYMGVNAIFASLSGDDEDKGEESRELTAEEKADLRLGMPDWQREHDFIARMVGGRIQMVDLTYALPHSMVVDLVKLATEGARTGRDGSLDSLARYISGEVLGANIAFSAAIETATNKDDYGNKIALETDSTPTAIAKLLTYYAKGTVMPSSVSKAVAVARPGETKRAELILGEVLGGRAVFHDTPVIAERIMRRLKGTQDDAVALRQVIQQGRYFDPAKVGEQLDLHQAALNKNQLRLHQALGTMRALGMSDVEIYKAADAVGLSKDTIRDATNGTRRSWTFAPDWARKLVANKAKMKEQEAGPVLDAVIEWIKKNPTFHPVVPEDEE